MQVNRHVYADAIGKKRFSDHLVDALAAYGTRAVFAMPAESLNPVIDAIRRDGRIRLIGVRHEGAGSLMASVYGKLTGRLGACMGTAGPGATHLPLGAYDALADRVGLLALSGQVPTEQVGLQSFQEIDAARLFDDCTVLSHYLGSPHQLGLVHRALSEAAVRQAPVHLACSSDVLAAPATVPRLRPVDISAAGAQADKTLLLDAAARLADQESVVLIGSATVPVGPEAGQLARKLGAPVFVLPEGSRSCPDPDVGPVIRVRSDLRDAVCDLLARAGRVIVVGARTASMARLASGGQVIQIAGGAESVHGCPPGWLRLLGEEREILRSLEAAAEPRSPGALAREADRLPSAPEPGPVWQALAEELPSDAVIAAEPGEALDAAFTALSGSDRILASSFTLAPRGVALPAAIGAALALPGRPVVAACTDSGLLDFMGELLTARRYELPVRVVCVERGADADAFRIGAASGFSVQRAASRAELAGGLAAMSAAPGPALLCVPGELADGAVGPSRERATLTRPSPAPQGGTVGAVLAEALAQSGSGTAYGRPGESTAGLVGYLRAAGIGVHETSNPESPAMMASAVAKYTGRPAVGIAAGDADLVLQLNGACDAAFDHAPVVMLSVAQSGLVHGRSLFGSIALSAAIDGTPASLAAAVGTIWQGLAAGKVVLVEIAAGALDGPAGEVALPPPAEPAKATLPAPDSLDEAARALHAARRPVVLAGRGAQGCSAELSELAGLLSAPIVTTMPGRGAIPEDDPNFGGGIGSSGHRSAAMALQECDVLLGLGLSRRGTSAFDLSGNFFMIQVDRDLSQLANSELADLVLHGTSAETLRALADHIRALGRPPAEVGREREEFSRKTRQAFASGLRRGSLALPARYRRGILPSRVAQTILAELVDGSSILTVDVGLVTLWIYRYLTGVRDFVWTGSFATMGFSVPAASALAPMANGRPVVAAVGDGGLAVTMSELASLAQADGPVVVMVFNNSKLGAIKWEQEIMGWPEYGSELYNGDLVEIAGSFGMRAARAATEKELRHVLRAAKSAGKPFLVDIICDSSELPAPAQPHLVPGQAFGFALALSREARRVFDQVLARAGGT